MMTCIKRGHECGIRLVQALPGRAAPGEIGRTVGPVSTHGGHVAAEQPVEAAGDEPRGQPRSKPPAPAEPARGAPGAGGRAARYAPRRVAPRLARGRRAPLVGGEPPRRVLRRRPAPPPAPRRPPAPWWRPGRGTAASDDRRPRAAPAGRSTQRASGEMVEQPPEMAGARPPPSSAPAAPSQPANARAEVLRVIRHHPAFAGPRGALLDGDEVHHLAGRAADSHQMAARRHGNPGRRTRPAPPAPPRPGTSPAPGDVAGEPRRRRRRMRRPQPPTAARRRRWRSPPRVCRPPSRSRHRLRRPDPHLGDRAGPARPPPPPRPRLRRGPRAGRRGGNASRAARSGRRSPAPAAPAPPAAPRGGRGARPRSAGSVAHRLGRIAEAEGLEHRHPVRRHLDAGADLLERRRLLQDPHPRPALRQRVAAASPPMPAPITAICVPRGASRQPAGEESQASPWRRI